MSGRQTCHRCGAPGACGEPPECAACFAHFYRHDPGSPYCCGGCDDCEAVLAEQDLLDSQRGQQVLDLGLGAA